MKLGAIIIFSLFLINSVSALTINYKNFEVNKTIGVDREIIFEVNNEQNFSFYNISFYNSSLIEVEPFNLTSNEARNITAKVVYDKDFNGEVKLIGFYETTLGQLNETHYIDVDYTEGINNCNLVIIEGDQVVFNNLVNDVITLRNADTNNDVFNINSLGNHTSYFDNPEVFNYFFLRRGFIFTDTCSVTALDDSGLVNNPNYDDFINLNLEVSFSPTSISTTFPNTEYEVNFESSVEDIFTIKNTGGNNAKDIHLSGDWFEFTINDFDLSKGSSKNIGFKIKPVILRTNETNKTYSKNITITGNFNDLVQNLDIFIPYAYVDESNLFNQTIDYELMKAVYLAYCSSNPEDDICEERVVYKNLNDSDLLFNVTMSQAQLKALWDFQFEESDKEDVRYNQIKEENYNQTLMINEFGQNLSSISEDFSSLREELDLSNSINFIILLVFLGFGGIGLLVYLIFNERFRSKFKFLKKW